MKLQVVKAILGCGLLVLSALILPGQELELPPVVVTGTFELQRGPSVTDLFTLHLLKQGETKRAMEEAVARSPWYYSRFWSYFPMKLDSSSIDPAQFLRPTYLSNEYQHAEDSLRRSEKHSIFDR
jgi:hypothetical protein